MLAPTAHIAPTAPAAPKSKRAPSQADEVRDGLLALRPELLCRARRLTRSQEVAEDLVQDTIERALRFESHYKRDSNIKAWAHQIMFNVFMSRCRRLRVERNSMVALAADPCSWIVPEHRPAMERLSPPVQRALDELPTDFRKVVMLVDLGDMSYAAAAKRLRTPVGTVMSRLHRGRKVLAERLREAA